MKNSLNGLDSRLDIAEERRSEFILSAVTGVHRGYSEVTEERVFNFIAGGSWKALQKELSLELWVER